MFQINEESKKKIYEAFNRTEIMVSEDVETIKKWIKDQPHLPEIMDDCQIRNFLHLNKFSIEKTKQRIDMYYTIRSRIPDYYITSNPKLEKMQQMLDNMHMCIFPSALHGIHRVILLKNKHPNVFSPAEFTMLYFAMFEVRLFEDFMYNDLLIFDIENLSFQDMTKMTPSVISKQVVLYRNVYAFRLKNLFFLNAPPFMSTLLATVKAVVKPKIFERIQVYRDATILHETFSKGEIPKDYGGDGPSLQELSDKMREKLALYRERFDLLDTLRVDESLRPGRLDDDEILGFHGNFRKLDVD